MRRENPTWTDIAVIEDPRSVIDGSGRGLTVYGLLSAASAVEGEQPCTMPHAAEEGEGQNELTWCAAILRLRACARLYLYRDNIVTDSC